MPQILPIDAKSVHQLLAGQVIGEGLFSVVKELVENALDAHPTSVDIRFKNYGLDSVEVCDNGDGISPEDYEGVCLKSYTSKLREFADLSHVDTFGFRGEALNSICALSALHIITATKDEAPKGSKLEFEQSGKLKSKSTVACQKGTTVYVENMFYTLPVRRQELNRNIKREYNKVLQLLQAYACVSTGVKFTVTNQLPKSPRSTVFATKANPTTRENISNVFGAKSVQQLVPLDLQFDLLPSSRLAQRQQESRRVHITGHISKPVVGGGRATHDRQMFFVNSRPCLLPQIAKAFNEVYKQYNVTQIPFIFADIKLDTNAYDVNVSPDKRTILLHDQQELLENLKESLVELFDSSEQTMPQSQIPSLQIHQALAHPPSAPRPTFIPPPPSPRATASSPPQSLLSSSPSSHTSRSPVAIRTRQRTPRQRSSDDIDEDAEEAMREAEGLGTPRRLGDRLREIPTPSSIPYSSPMRRAVTPQARKARVEESPSPAVITIGDKTVVVQGKDWGEPIGKRARMDEQAARGSSTRGSSSDRAQRTLDSMPGFVSALQKFTAPGTQEGSARKLIPQGDSDEDMSEQEVEPESARRTTRRTLPRQTRRASPEPDEMDVDDEILEEPDEESSVAKATDGDEISSDPDYVDEETEREKANFQVEKLIQEAEEIAQQPSEKNLDRAKVLIRGDPKSCTKSRISLINVSEAAIEKLGQGYLRKSEIEPLDTKPNVADDVTSKTVEERLSLTVSKSDFSKMRIIGQFNKGFIITTRTNTTGQCDLFIIDQHASDEKFHFEKFQEETVVQDQPLVIPKLLELTALEEEILMDNMEVVKKNGFKVEVDRNAPTGRKCKLVAIPMSKNVVFGVQDLEELIHLIHQSPYNTSLRCTKVRKMFASRACRSSVMVGHPLQHNKMRKIVNHMGELDKPWNCPHGRPTMRHLCELNLHKDWDGDEMESRIRLQWGSNNWKHCLRLYGETAEA